MDYATARDIPVVRCADRLNQETEQKIVRADPDIIISANWRRRISQSILENAKHGGVNVHRSLLPKYGGLDPISWAIAKGEKEAGVTIHVIDEELDLGDIILQRPFPIGWNDTAFDVHRKSMPLVANMISEALAQFEDGSVTRTSQDRTQATFFHKRSERDTRIDWTRTNGEIYNLVRAQSDPFPNAFTFATGKKLRIKKASLAEPRYHGTPGQIVLRTPDGVMVLCGKQGATAGQGLVIHTVQEERGDPLNANEYFDRMGCYLGYQR